MKKIIIPIVLLILTWIFLIALIFVLEKPIESSIEISGDIDGNGEIQLLDLLIGSKYINGEKFLTEDEIDRGDINRNGDIDQLDLDAIQSHLLGIKVLN